MSCHLSRDATRSGLPIDQWPRPFRLAWLAAKAKSHSPFREERGSANLSEHTLQKSEKGLRRWLGFLTRSCNISEDTLPLDCLQPDVLDAYFIHLKDECHNASRSVYGRFEELKLAYELMFPGQSFTWLVKPNGIPLTMILPRQRKPRFVPSAVDLQDLAAELFQAGLEKKDAQIRCGLIRDAVMISLLASRAPRLRALWSLRLGVHLIREDGGWLLDQDRAITKMGNEVAFPLASDTSVMMDRYVSIERSEMLRGAVSDALWICWYGRPMAQPSISALMWKRTLEYFGTGFGPHRARVSLTTTLAAASPSTPWDAATLLAHGKRTSLQNYNMAKAFGAARRHDNHLAELRRRTEALAHESF